MFCWRICLRNVIFYVHIQCLVPIQQRQVLSILIVSLRSSSSVTYLTISSQNSWQGQTFVYERTRIDKVLLDPTKGHDSDSEEQFTDDQGNSHGVHENSEAHVEGMDRMERFLR